MMNYLFIYLFIYLEEVVTSLSNSSLEMMEGVSGA